MNDLKNLLSALKACDQNPAASRRYFKTKPGAYAAHDHFLGIKNSDLRRIAKQFPDLSLAQLAKLLAAPHNEVRALALFILTNRYPQVDAAEKTSLYEFYLQHLDRVNNWNLVDISAHLIVGHHLYDKDRGKLVTLAQASSLWLRRVAIVATLYFIRQGDLVWTYQLADLLLEDKEDLIHKALGWMLREAGKQDLTSLTNYLDAHCQQLPRTTLRYAIERFPEQLRLSYLRRK